LIDCGNVPAASHGHYELTFDPISTVGSTANLICNPGYSPQEIMIVCLESGNWNESTCERQGNRNRSYHVVD